MTDQTFGELLRDKRESMLPRVSLRDMAGRLGYSPSFLSDMENDRRRPSEAACYKIAEFYSLPIDEVMSKGGVNGAQTERYLKRNPQARRLLRLLALSNVDSSILSALENHALNLMANKANIVA